MLYSSDNDPANLDFLNLADQFYKNPSATNFSKLEKAMLKIQESFNQYVVVYQTGESDNFEWKQGLSVDNYAMALGQRDQLRRMGYPSFVYTQKHFKRRGLPTKYVKPNYLTK